jgi:hypothetical protein
MRTIYNGRILRLVVAGTDQGNRSSLIAERPHHTSMRAPRVTCAVLLLALSGCSNLVLSKEDAPAAGADPALNEAVANQIKSTFCAPGASHTSEVAAKPGNAKEGEKRLQQKTKTVSKCGDLNYASYEPFEISAYRWVQGMKGWSWLTCVRFHDRDHLRTYAFFVKDDKVIDNRYAVETDSCDVQSYAPFDPGTGLLQPVGIGGQQPIY